MKWILGPFAAWLILLPYAALMSTIYGYAWVNANSILLDEYLFLVSLYYTVCLLGHTLKSIKSVLPKQ